MWSKTLIFMSAWVNFNLNRIAKADKNGMWSTALDIQWSQRRHFLVVCSCRNVRDCCVCLIAITVNTVDMVKVVFMFYCQSNCLQRFRWLGLFGVSFINKFTLSKWCKPIASIFESCRCNQVSSRNIDLCSNFRMLHQLLFVSYMRCVFSCDPLLLLS